jgi:hypothetical protein
VTFLDHYIPFDGSNRRVDFPPWSAGLIDCALRAAVLNVAGEPH